MRGRVKLLCTVIYMYITSVLAVICRLTPVPWRKAENIDLEQVYEPHEICQSYYSLRIVKLSNTLQEIYKKRISNSIETLVIGPSQYFNSC